MPAPRTILNKKLARQIAALPWRTLPDGGLEFLLVTSRSSGRWLIPKGWPIPGKGPARSAQQEAFEEAGIKGKISSKPLGDYNYLKLLHDGEQLPCVVHVFGLRHVNLLDEWPEQGQRERRWFKPEEAAAAVFEAGLSEFLSNVAIKVRKADRAWDEQHAAAGLAAR